MTMVRRLGFFYGAAFVTGGVLGFVPGVTVDDVFLGIFAVNPLHSAMHVASGVTFLVGSVFSTGAVRLWFQDFRRDLCRFGCDGLLGRQRHDPQLHHQQSQR